MHKRHLLALYRLFFGVLTLWAVWVQFAQGSTRESFDPVNFLSFFTIESNIIAAVLFIVSAALTARGSQSTALTILRGAATLYMLVTGVVYSLLLSGLEESLQTTIPWVNAVLHYIMPAAVLFDWCIDIPKRRMLFRRALVWLAFPAAYLFYSLVRGAVVGWYPYPFLNPAYYGYAGVVVTCVGILGGMVALIWLLTKSTHIVNRK
ncbi:MAG TPA: Pr6Pr family membrane protein [Candidatus Saccharimonadales bacterium]|nr:Pr6Pr family membrane protein [Candidatus Saccharimonadales bacterium]